MTAPNDIPKTLRAPLRLTHIGMVAERAARAFWPLWTLACLCLALWGSGLLAEVSWLPLVVVMVFAGLGLLGAAWFAQARFAWPSRAEALGRLDQTLPGRPIHALTDSAAIGAADPAAQAVWQAHITRMEARLAQARAARPDLRVSNADPYALRYGALLLLAVVALFGGVWRGSDLSVGLGTGAAEAVQAGPAWEIWLEPPRYTGKPTLYLADVPRGQVQVPIGTQVIVRLYGAEGALSIDETISGRPNPDPTAPAQSFAALNDGRLAVDGAEGAARWSIVLMPDTAPTIAPDGAPRHDPPSGMQLAFDAVDDYGINSAEARITLDMAALDRRYGLAVAPEPREALVLGLPLPIAGDRAEFAEILVDDVSKHPFANLPVSITLSATDAAQQVGLSAPFTAELPGRSFFDPLANALIEQRRDLLWSRENAARTAMILRTLTHDPEEGFGNTWPYFLTRMVIGVLEHDTDLTAARRDDLAEMLWQAAVKIEETSLEGALARLRRAQERLTEAIRQGASPEEIQRLTDELRQAMDDYIRQRALEEARNGQNQDGTDQPDQNQAEGQQITPDQLDQLMERIQELMEQGRTAEAMQLLQELQQMLENLQFQQGQGGAGPGFPGGQGDSLGELRDTLREQQDLSDEAFRELQERFDQEGQGPSQDGQGQEGQGPSQDGQGQDGQGQGSQRQGGRQSLAERQNDLRDRLNQLRRNMPGQGTPEGEEAGRALDQAGRAMDEAARSLEEGRLADALDDQSRAMDALRQGLDSMGRAMSEAQRRNAETMGDGTTFGEVQPRDPLGRDSGGNGALPGDGPLAEGGDAGQRARELQDEIRRRSAEQDRPEAERDYLNRLLDRF